MMGWEPLTRSRRAKNEKSRCLRRLHYSLIDQKKKTILSRKSQQISKHWLAFHFTWRSLPSMKRCFPSTYIYIYIFIVHCDRHVNKPESDGPTSNHYHHFLRPYGECDCVEERELLVGRSDVSFWFLFRIKSRQFNSPRPRRRTF